MNLYLYFIDCKIYSLVCSRQTRQNVTNSYKDNHRSYETLYTLSTFERRTKIIDGNANTSRRFTNTDQVGG